jgi:hypothetical protein
MDDVNHFIYVDDPYWLDEAFTDAISTMDTGILDRNLRYVARISLLLETSRHPFHSGVDLGGGYGLFVRGMRDKGFDFYWSDKYAENLAARGFEAKEGSSYDVAVAIEVLEHIPNPAVFISDCKKKYDFKTLFFSAECFDPAKVPEKDWWYWTFESGQHISFFSELTLNQIAAMNDMRLFDFGYGLYAMSSHDLSFDAGFRGRLRRKFINSCRFGSHSRKSFMVSDMHLMRQRFRSNG